MKRIVTKIRFIVMFLLPGKKKREKKMYKPLRLNSTTDQVMLERVLYYKAILDSIQGSPDYPVPQASIYELNVAIADYYDAFYDYQFEKTNISLFRLRAEREKLSGWLQFFRHQLKGMNLLK